MSYVRDELTEDKPHARTRLALVLQAAGDIIQIEDAENALGLSRTQAAKILSRWTRIGWVKRIGPGAYIPVPLDSFQSDQILSDPWLLVPTLFDPAYIGGRTAAEHWDLTEQIFRDIVVMTSQTIRSKIVEREGTLFSLKHVRKESMFGLKTAWRSQTKVLVSDVHRTIVDILSDPSIGGGIQHVHDCFNTYMSRADRDLDKLIDYGDQLANGAVFKRLGFLAEMTSNGAELIEPCSARLTKGTAKLDPYLDCSRLRTKWRLLIPQTWA